MVHGSLLLKMFSSGFYGNKSSLTQRLAVEESCVRDRVGNSHAQAESAAGISYGDYGPTGSAAQLYPFIKSWMPSYLCSTSTKPRHGRKTVS